MEINPSLEKVLVNQTYANPFHPDFDLFKIIELGIYAIISL
jgi:hypothetical protein